MDIKAQEKALFRDKLAAMDDHDLEEACDSYIFLSAFANNNPRSDFHWQCDMTYDECKRRNKIEIYTRAHKSFTKG